MTVNDTYELKKKRLFADIHDTFNIDHMFLF